LLPLIGGKSLLRLAYDRLDGLVPPERRWVCAAGMHRSAVLAALPGLSDNRYLGEPVGRDTLAALAYASAVIARTDADAANLVLSNHDQRDAPFLTGERSSEGFYHANAGIEQAIARGLAYAPYADLVWCETSKPDMAQARRFAEAIHARYPDQLLAYNCSPSFNWQKHVDAPTMRRWREELGAMGYRFQFITLAGWHALNLSMFELASAYRDEGMYGYSQLQQREFAQESAGYRAAKHQAFVGTGYFDAVQTAITAGQFSTGAMAGSTETEQFTGAAGGKPALTVAR
jgi:isocitrate lyase